VVRDAVAHTPRVLATCEELRTIAGEPADRACPLPRPRRTTIRACADEFSIDGSAIGATLRILTRPAPPPPNAR
jgi:hypothetical protein